MNRDAIGKSRPQWLRRGAERLRELRRMLRRGIAVGRSRLGKPRRPHDLPARLVVSLTSYPPRFKTLSKTLISLLNQDLIADELILWVSWADESLLPDDVRALTSRGLKIRPCDDSRSYKKLLPALLEFPDAFIVTADDDVFYPRNWLGELVGGFDPSDPTITCHRGHRIALAGNSVLIPYGEWLFDVQDERARRPSSDLVPTGVGGILYPPGSLHPMVQDAEIIARTCPYGDDLWFYWMARLNGWKHKKVGGVFKQVDWAGSQESALHWENVNGRNDVQVRALLEALGNPLVI